MRAFYWPSKYQEHNSTNMTTLTDQQPRDYMTTTGGAPMTDLYINVPSPDLRGKLKGKKISIEVTYPVSYTYNGGITINGKWYAGHKVGEPIIDKDCELVSICVGLELNARPPRATMVLRRIS